MAGPAMQETVSGEEYIVSLARYIRTHSEQLSSASASLKGTRQDGHGSWVSMLYLSSQAPKPLTLTLDLYHLYYVLLKIQEAGFADVGNMDEPLRLDHHRRPALPAASLTNTNDTSDTLSIKSSFSTISKGLSSIGSGWWGASASTSVADSAAAVEKDLKLIYTAFTLIPSLKLIRQDRKGKAKAIAGFDYPDLPGDRMLPLKTFKSLERLELEDIDARVVLFSGEWDNIVNLRVTACGMESLSELVRCCKAEKENNLSWGPRLRILDLERNDVFTIDAEETVGLERVISLNLRQNLLVSVPAALSSLTSLRALDLSGNMIDSVLSIYSSLPGLSILNLRGNRISSLCGIERLLSIEKLDVRDNDIYDAAEVTRLVTLPHLTDLWIGEGNPFLEDASSRSGHGWRVRFFESFLNNPDRISRRSLAELPRLDGSRPSWNEQRHLSHEHDYSATASRHPDSAREITTWPRQTKGQDNLSTTDIAVSANVKTLRSRKSHHFDKKGSNMAMGTGLLATQTTTPAPMSPSSDAPVRSIKKKHRRVVNLDGEHLAAGTLPDQERGSHRRSATSPGNVMEAQASADSAVPAKQPLKHKSLPRSPRAGKQSSRALTKDTFKDPALITDGNEHIDSGSEADEFRRKMEKLRQDVGANNWLSVYANAVQSKQAP